jgi:wobble nucleotide-excising tRNase
MIAKINKIKDFGIFKDFKWSNSLQPFKKYNLMYGWNYSGKTTISRLFRSFEQQKLHQDYQKAIFEIEDNTGVKFNEKEVQNNLSIRAFNTDFINDNLKWDESIEPIIILGEENLKLQEQLKSKKETLKTITDKISDNSKKVKIESKRISDGLSDKAKELKLLLSKPDYEKRHFQKIVEGIVQHNNGKTLDDDELILNINTYNKSEKKNEISKLNPLLPDLNKLIETTSIILKTTVKSNVIQRLKDNPELNSWVKTELVLHQNIEHCEFCGNKLPSTLINDLNEHFSKEYDKLLLTVDDTVKKYKIRFNIAYPEQSAFYDELQSEFIEIKNKTNEEIEKFNTSITKIILQLEEKKTKAFSELLLTEIINNSSEIQSYIEKINNLITLHNKKNEEFESLKEKAFDSIIVHNAQDFINNEKYFDTKQDIENTEESIKLMEEEKNKTLREINEIEKQLSDLVKGAEKINDYLKSYFGKVDLKIKVIQENKFQIYRNDILARNLSEGEKTAIAFAHFVTKLEDKDTNFTDTILFIDDPVSSLDSNHIFNTYSLIKTKLLDCKQLFISTHNFEFYNLIKEGLQDIDSKSQKSSFYFIERATNNSIDEATIIPIPDLILKFKSEYCYLFSLIFEFKTSQNANFKQLYNLPNILSRYLEAFTSFKYPGKDGFNKRMKILIDNEIEAERVIKFVHHFSHSMSVNSSLQFPDLKECLDIIDIAIKSVQNKDQEHYNYLNNLMTT